MLHSRVANKVLFFFLECPLGVYGTNCLENCSLTCGHPGKCDRVTGHCNGGCQRGWTGVGCEEGKRHRNNKHANISIHFKLELDVLFKKKNIHIFIFNYKMELKIINISEKKEKHMMFQMLISYQYAHEEGSFKLLS